jgi:hypothetical protein
MMAVCLLALLLPGVYWDSGPDTAAALKQAGIRHISVPPSIEASWKGQSGILVEAVDMASVVKLITPGVKMRLNTTSATRSPWVESNGWRLIREPRGRYYYEAPGALSALAAAEAFVYGGNALVHTDLEGLEPLGRMLAFLEQLEIADLPVRADIGYIDDGSPESGELMNLMVRKNLLFKLVPSPDPRLALNVKFGSSEYPKEEAAEPSRLAQKVRTNLTDAKRTLRIFGAETFVARAVGDGKRTRVHLLNYLGARGSGFDLRLRIRGRFLQPKATVFGVANANVREYMADSEATEFTLPELGMYAVIDLVAAR